MSTLPGEHWTDENTHIQQLAYLYKYDNNNRMIAKKLPGADWEYYIYDKEDRLIASQDGEMRRENSNKWQFTIPDIWGRSAVTGTFIKSLSYTTNPLGSIVVKATRTNATDMYKGYSISGLSGQTSVQILTVNYYDDYKFIGTNGISSTDAAYNAEGSFDTRHTGVYNGLLTGTLTAQIEPDGMADTYLYTVMYYDNRGRVIQTKSNSHLEGGIEREYIAYNFTDQPVKKRLMHIATGRSMQTQNITYEYDHAGRLTKQTHQAGMYGRIIPITTGYDELGRVSRIRRNDRDRLSGTYHYDIRSRLTAIRENHFHETLTYYPNGNVETMEWIHGGQIRKYTFDYDGLSRLTTALFEGTGVGWENFSTTYNYDKNGNITQLQRNGRIHYGDVASSYGLVDDMTLQYTGNQLMNVTDAGAFVGLSESNDFKKYSSSNPGYAYNPNGAMTKDLNKGISSISYNVLNLPQVMDIKNPVGEGRNTYTYAADGRKLKLVQQWNSNYSTTPTIGTAINTANLNQTKTTEYIGNIVYEQVNSQQMKKTVYFDGGYAEGGNYYFYLRNHLGSVAIVAKEDDSVVQNVLYYPFGAPLIAFGNTRHVQPYKFGEKEFDMMHGLNWYDFSARYYDGATGRFTTMDPLAEKYYSWSPYAYCFNNPMRYADPTGMSVEEGNPNIDRRNIWAWLKSLFTPRIDARQETSDEREDRRVVEKQESKFQTSTEELDKTSTENTFAGAMLLTGILLGDDVTGIGVSDDIAIPFVWIVAGGLAVYYDLTTSGNSSKNEKHGDAGRAKTKAEKQIEDLEAQKQGATTAEKKAIDTKIRNIKRTAEKRAKGEEHSRGNKR